MPSSHLECLPTELLIAITDHLPSGHSILLLRYVSKTLYDILTSHDVVSHALVTHYPHSAEARLPLTARTRKVFDDVVRRTYTQPRRRSPRKTIGVNCYPMFCAEDEGVLAYRTEAQKMDPGWACTLWDMVNDVETVVEIRSEVGGCYNECGVLFSSAVLRDIWCEKGRGVMVVGGRHKHVIATSPADLEQGPLTGKKIELGYYGVHIAPRLWHELPPNSPIEQQLTPCSRYEHTFFHVYSLDRADLGRLLSSFTFFGTTNLTHTAANSTYFTSLSAGSLFIYNLSPKPTSLTAPPPAPPPALWRDLAYSSSTTALAADAAGTHIFIYNDPGIGGFYDRGNGSVAVLDAKTGATTKKVILGDSRNLFEYRLERDDSRLWEWRFEAACKPVYRVAAGQSMAEVVQKDKLGVETGEEVTVSWTGTYGVFGTRGGRISLEGLNRKCRFTGEKTPVMVSWTITTFPIRCEEVGAIPREKVNPMLFFAPAEFEGGGMGVMGVPALEMGFEDVSVSSELVRWPVAVCRYLLAPGKPGMIKWGSGRGGYYTSSGREKVLDEGVAVTVWFDVRGNAPWGVEREGGGRMVFPRWRGVLGVGAGGKLGEGGRVDNRFVYEGCGWLLYRVLGLEKGKGGKGKEKEVPKVVVVEYDDSDMEVEEIGDEGGVEMEEGEGGGGRALVRGTEGVGDKLVLLRF